MAYMSGLIVANNVWRDPHHTNESYWTVEGARKSVAVGLYRLLAVSFSSSATVAFWASARQRIGEIASGVQANGRSTTPPFQERIWSVRRYRFDPQANHQHRCGLHDVGVQ